MAGSRYNFQYCQKLVVLDRDLKRVFLAKRQGEADYDGTWSFIGGKLETSDESIIAGLKREKDEEAGPDFKLKIYPKATNNLLFRKKDGSAMVLPHYLAVYAGGIAKINEQEYSDAQWFELERLESLEPKIPNIPEPVDWVVDLSNKVSEQELVLI